MNMLHRKHDIIGKHIIFFTYLPCYLQDGQQDYDIDV